MKKMYLAGFILLSVWSSCMWGVPKKQVVAVIRDTLDYTYQTVKDRAADCGDKPDSGCTTVAIKYPVFKSNHVLSDTVIKKLVNLFDSNKKDTSLNQLSAGFLKSYDDFKKSNTRPNVFFSLDGYATVLRQDSSLISLEVGGYDYNGGAHGETLIHFINWNTKTNRNIQLSDILINGYEEKLKAAGERIFRKQEDLSDTASLARDYFFKNARFALNNNFSITPFGIRFIYNQYEIKPYAAGQTDLLIPYTQIKPLLRPNSVVSQYNK